MTKPLEKIINSEQSAFLPGRQIIDNIMLAQMIQDYCTRCNIPGILALLDQEKAYDRVEHLFMYKVLERMGFPMKITAAIKMLYHEASSKILVNGHLSPSFAINRGVRQGDPLSCVLFISVIEVLSRALKKEIKGIRLPDGSAVTHSLFADDTKVILSNVNEIPVMMKILHRYGRASGAKINLSKSSLLAIGAQETPDGPYIIPWARDGESVTYLGCPLGNKINTEEKWNEIMRKLQISASLWSTMGLSLKGRIMTANVMMCSRLWYHARLLPISDKKTKDFSKIIMKFIWKGKHNRVAAGTCTQAINQGGLNLIDIQHMIDAIRVQWVRRLYSNPKHQWKEITFWSLRNSSSIPEPGLVSCIWIQKLRSIHTDTLHPLWKCTLLSWKRLKGGLLHQPSTAQQTVHLPIWYNKDVIPLSSQKNKAFDKLRRLLRTATIGDIAEIGKGLHVQTDGIPDSRAQRSCQSSASKICNTIEENIRNLIVNGQIVPTSPLCISPLLGFCRNEEKLDLLDASVRKLRTLGLSPPNINMVNRLNALADEDGITLPWPKIWASTRNKQALRQAGDVHWLLLHNAIYTGTRLAAAFNDDTLAACNHCGERESAEHLFLSCTRVKTFWTHLISDWTEMFGGSNPNDLRWTTVACGFPNAWSKTQQVNECWPVFFLAGIWAIWTARNGLRYGDEIHNQYELGLRFQSRLSSDLRRIFAQHQSKKTLHQFTKRWSTLSGLYIINREYLIMKYKYIDW